MSDYEKPTGWTGWIAFAAIMLMIGGVLEVFYGFVALFNDTWVLSTEDQIFLVDISSWGWAHIIWGAVVFFAGLLLLRGNMLGRIVGVIAASVSMIINFVFLPAAPFWAITVIVIDALVIWAIIVHGKEMKSV